MVFIFFIRHFEILKDFISASICQIKCLDTYRQGIMQDFSKMTLKRSANSLSVEIYDSLFCRQSYPHFVKRGIKTEGEVLEKTLEIPRSPSGNILRQPRDETVEQFQFQSISNDTSIFRRSY